LAAGVTVIVRFWFVPPNTMLATGIKFGFEEPANNNNLSPGVTSSATKKPSDEAAFAATIQTGTP